MNASRRGRLPAKERRPVIVEIAEDGRDVDGAGFDGAETGFAEEGGEVVGVAEGEAGALVEIAGGNPFYELQTRIRGMVDDSAGPGSADQEVEIEAD